mgnify:CR=1 FL=1
MPTHCVNPQTGRCIRKDSALYRRLVKLGVISDDLPEVGSNRVYQIKEGDTDTEIEQVKETIKVPPHKKVVKGRGKNQGYLVKRTDIRPETVVDATISAQQKVEDGNTDVLSDLEKRIAAHLGLIDFE